MNVHEISPELGKHLCTNSNQSHQKLGLKHRSLKIWVGWTTWTFLLFSMARVYDNYLFPFCKQIHVPSIVSLVGAREECSGLSGSTYNCNTGQSEGKQATEWPSPDYANDNANVEASLKEGFARFQDAQWTDVIGLLEPALVAANRSLVERATLEKAMLVLATSYIEVEQWANAQAWMDALYVTARAPVAEPAYRLCRRLRERGLNNEAFYYYLLANSLPSLASSEKQEQQQQQDQEMPSAYISAVPGLHEYLLAYEKSILWSYVGGFEDRYVQLHGLALSMHLLDTEGLPNYIRDSVFNNLQFYAPHLRGVIMVIRPEKSTQEEWRYSTPTFVNGRTFVRVVNYYVANDGSYHVSKGDKVNTRLMLEPSEEYFDVGLSDDFRERAQAKNLIHPDAYILGLEDTRVVVDATHGGVIHTLSASAEYSFDGRGMNQVLGVLDTEQKTLTVHGVIHGPYPDRHDKNWVFAGGIDNVVYGWYPQIEIGRVDQEQWALRIHTEIPVPASFYGMRGSTSGVLYKGGWWFVTHAVIYRSGQMRKYLHRFVVLNDNLTAIERYSLPFTFEKAADVEYCLGLQVDGDGVTLGYSVRDRSSRVMTLPWESLGELFDEGL